MIRRHPIYLLCSLLVFSSLAQANSCPTYTPQVFEGYFNVPNQITTDGNGNVWVKNSGDDTIAKINPANSNVQLYQSDEWHFSAPFFIDADQKGNLWILSAREKKLTKIPVDNPTVPIPLVLDQVKQPKYIAAGSDDRVWVIDGQASVMELSGEKLNKRTVFSDSKYQFKNLSGMVSDANGNIWVGGTAGKVTLLPGSIPSMPAVFAAPKYPLPQATALMTTDAQGNIYVVDSWGNSVTKINVNGPTVTAKTYSGAKYQFDQPSTITVDPEGNIWIGNSEAVVVEIPANNDDAPIIYDGVQYEFGMLGGMAADVHGNIWILNIDKHSVTKLIVSRNAC